MFSEPVIGERFFGREDILELLNKRASALKDGYRQNIALTGQSLVGKSSVILHFLRNIREEGIIPVYVEVVKEPFGSFAEKFIATMLYNALTRMGELVGVDLAEIMLKAQKILPKTSVSIKHIYASMEKGEVDEAYSSLLGLTSVLKEEVDFSCIVILDEFDNLEHLGIKNPFLGFGKVIMVQKDTMYVVSSSRNQAIKKILSEKLSLLFGNFEIIKLSNFDSKAASRYMASKLAGFDIEPALAAFLIDFTDGNPFYLENMLERMRKIATEKMTSYINKDVVGQSILELVYNSSGTIHQYLMNFVLELLDSKHKETRLTILNCIANGTNKQSEIARKLKTKQCDAAKSLISLSELGIISKNGIFFKIDDIMLEFWLKNVYQRRKSLLVDGTFDRMTMFYEDIGRHIDRFNSDHSSGVITRIAELFGLFANELVQIDFKQLRLPHFTRVDIKPFPDTRQFISSSYRSNFWVTQPFESPVNENDVISYIRNIKHIGLKPSNKVIITMAGIDENAKLLAKELRIAIWDLSTINMLFKFYGKNRVVIT